MLKVAISTLKTTFFTKDNNKFTSTTNELSNTYKPYKEDKKCNLKHPCFLKLHSQRYLL